MGGRVSDGAGGGAKSSGARSPGRAGRGAATPTEPPTPLSAALSAATPERG